MIRILHTSDWHLGKRLERFSRHDEQVELLQEICEIVEREHVDLILVAGDLFDAFNPPAESLELFYRSLKKLSQEGARPVIAIAGNHDMPERIEAPDPLARECGIIFAGFPESTVAPFTLENRFSLTRSEPGFIELQLPQNPPVRLMVTPYASEMRLKRALNPLSAEEELRDILKQHWDQLAQKHFDRSGVNLMVAHLLFMNEGDDIPEEPDDERPINHIGGAQAIYTSSLPSDLQYVALGHLHRKQVICNSPCPVVYSGSPLPYSFSEAGQEKFVVCIDLEPGKPAEIRNIPLTSGKQLERKRFETMQEAETWLIAHPDALVEMTLVSDTYLSGEDRRHLADIHKGIITIIPEIRDAAIHGEEGAEPVIPGQVNLPELFEKYFVARKGQQPDQDIRELLKEIISE
jgi:exonuclease SbcD